MRLALMVGLGIITTLISVAWGLPWLVLAIASPLVVVGYPKQAIALVTTSGLMFDLILSFSWPIITGVLLLIVWLSNSLVIRLLAKRPLFNSLLLTSLFVSWLQIFDWTQTKFFNPSQYLLNQLSALIITLMWLAAIRLINQRQHVSNI